VDARAAVAADEDDRRRGFRVGGGGRFALRGLLVEAGGETVERGEEAAHALVVPADPVSREHEDADHEGGRPDALLEPDDAHEGHDDGREEEGRRVHRELAEPAGVPFLQEVDAHPELGQEKGHEDAEGVEDD
jgi:hypothetical protein